MSSLAVLGHAEYSYVADPLWGRGPRGRPELGVAQGVTGDSRDRVYVFQRTPTACMLVFEPGGDLVDEWGHGAFELPHGIAINARDELLLTDLGTHTVTKWTTDGRLLRTWGEPGVAGSPGRPFNRPTKAVETPSGELYVSDGYGNHHVHRFAADGELIQSWGGEGTERGQFTLPHDVVVDGDDVLVCDREGRRVQRFGLDGGWLGEWATDWGNPMQLFVRGGLIYAAHSYPEEISVRRRDGALLARWPYESALVNDLNKWPHSLWADSTGAIYVGEVFGSGGLQKYSRRG
jgi:hypothetical protein